MAEVARSVKQAHEMYLKFKKLYEDKTKADEFRKMITEMKVIFASFPTFLNPDVQTPTRAQEVMLVRETLEHAVLLAAASCNMHDFAQNFEILRVYYTDFKDEPKSERRLLILGLHLLRLLAMNEIRAYHMELERIEVVDHDSMYIKDVVQLERYIMEGSYHKMLQARSKVPSTHYTPLMEMLLVTVRREVFKCASSAYEELSVEGARKLLMFDNAEDLMAFVTEERTKLGDAATAWAHQGNKFTFAEDDHPHASHLPFTTVMQNQLYYSHELQRIA